MVAESSTAGRILKPRMARMSLIRELLQETRARMDEELQPVGITLAQLRVLWSIEMMPEASGAEIARHCAITPQSGQAIIARLEANGWIRRHHSTASDRVLNAEPTAAGRKILLKAKEISEHLDRELWQGTPARDLAAIDAALTTALSRVRQR